jgi:outer membrane lipoprotein-sorting protein
VSLADRQAALDEKKSAGNVDPAAAAAGQALLDQATKAAGGVAALRKIHTLRVTASGTLTMQGQSMPLGIVMSDVPQKSRRVEMSIGPMKIVQVVSEKGAFMQQGDQVKDLPAAMATTARKELQREPNILLANGTSGGAKVRGLPQATDGAAHFDVLEIISSDGDTTQLWLDPKTHLISRMVYSDDGKETRQDYSDYRAQGGVQLAWKTRHVGGSGEQIEMVLEKVEINPELAPSLFSH